MLEFDNVTPARYERIHEAAQKINIALPQSGQGAVAFHGVSGTSNYARQLGQETGTLTVEVTHVPSLFGLDLIKPVEAEDKVRQFIEGVQ